jgi:hypothetical protein
MSETYYILGEGTISGVRNWILWGVKRRKGNRLLFPLPVEMRVLKLTDWERNSKIQLDHQILHSRTASRFVLWKLVSQTCPYTVTITKIQYKGSDPNFDTNRIYEQMIKLRQTDNLQAGMLKHSPHKQCMFNTRFKVQKHSILATKYIYFPY